jgi:glycine dehydrogenase subunit 2
MNQAKIGRHNFDFNEPLLFEKRNEGCIGVDLPEGEASHEIADDLVILALGDQARGENEELLLSEHSEPEICRHFTRLSRWNFSIDTNSYPLGSCTMKHNPRINEWAGRLPGFSQLHPYLPVEKLQGALSIMWDLQNFLCEIGGFSQTTLQPSAGAQGEFVGVMMIKAALKARGETRNKILVPQSAHGTNPATASFFGFEVVSLRATSEGCIDLEDIKAKMNEDTAGIMITNPNTLGIFEKDIVTISHIIHDQGGFVYGDGANLNALMGVARPGDFGIDVMHFNLHKTFTTPHGGGGPGCGAVGASPALMPFLPIPLVAKKNDGSFCFDNDRPLSIGKVRSFYGNFGMMIRAWTYIREMGPVGLKKASELAVLNANYIRARLKDHYHLAYQTDCLHEVVFTDKWQQEKNHVSTLDIAKRLIDYGIHPPTIYFPLVVSGALMIEPTETESKLEVDAACAAFIAVANEAKNNPEDLKSAPQNTAMRRLDEVFAARNPLLKWTPDMPSSKEAFKKYAEDLKKHSQ